jgi:hypothetical protein
VELDFSRVPFIAGSVPLYRSLRPLASALMGMVVISSTVTVGPIAETLDPEGKPIGKAGKFLDDGFLRFADDLAWWTEAAKAQRQRRAPPF